MGQATAQHVAVGQVHTVIVDVSLDDEALSDAKAMAKSLTHLHDGQRDLVTRDGGVGRQVASVEAGVVPSTADELDIGEAEAHSVNAGQQLIWAWHRHRQPHRPVISSQVVQPGPIKGPGPHHLWDRLPCCPVVPHDLTHHSLPSWSVGQLV